MVPNIPSNGRGCLVCGGPPLSPRVGPRSSNPRSARSKPESVSLGGGSAWSLPDRCYNWHFASSSITPSGSARGSACNMKASNTQWAKELSGKMPEDLSREIDIFETEMALRKQGKLDERLFAETRLRRGIYGQRYDNGQRHDGKKVQEVAYPSGELTKGPNTMWDAPGMLRIKIPGGGLNAAQLETMADLAEEYSDGIAHVTTRQDFQLHYVHIEDTPSVMRRLAAAKITTREACGNSVRNVTACPYAGTCQDEVFDVTPYSRALAKFLLGHPDCQNFGRKFKPAFSGCAQHACGLTSLHDIGFIAVKRVVDGKEKRGF